MLKVFNSLSFMVFSMWSNHTKEPIKAKAIIIMFMCGLALKKSHQASKTTHRVNRILNLFISLNFKNHCKDKHFL